MTKATELGDAWAHYQLALSYHHGNGVEKDREKEIFHFEEAAIVVTQTLDSILVVKSTSKMIIQRGQ